MRYQKPVYFDAFRCIADKCPETCCAGWQIMIDEDSLETYAHVGGAFGNRLRNSIDWEEGCFYQYEGRCAFLNEKNLCDLVTEMGENALCETCSRYPRHVEEFEDVREWSLSISCPVAAKMVLDGEDPLELISTEDDEEDPLEEDFEDFDLFLFTKLEDAREQICNALKSASALELESCFRQIYRLASDMQECLEENKDWKLDEVISQFGDAAKSSLAPGSAKEYYQRRKAYFECLSKMEHLRTEWGCEVEEAFKFLYQNDQDGYENYEAYREKFLTSYGPDGGYFEEWQRFKKNLFWFFIYTYFCGAVYDDWIVTKAGMACFAVDCVEELVMYHSISDTAELTKEDWIKIAGFLAREVEHSDDNLNWLEEWLWQRWEGRERTEFEGD